MFELPAVEKEPEASRVEKSPRSYRNPVLLAKEWKDAISSGDCPSQVYLSRKLGISRARVNQMLRLLSLAPEVLEAIAALGDPMKSRIVTERQLREIVALPVEEQKKRVKEIIDKK